MLNWPMILALGSLDRYNLTTNTCMYFFITAATPGKMLTVYAVRAFQWIQKHPSFVKFAATISIMSTTSKPTWISSDWSFNSMIHMDLQGPVNYICLHCVKPSLRPLSMAMSTVSIHIFGDVPSSPLVGVLQVCFLFSSSFIYFWSCLRLL